MGLETTCSGCGKKVWGVFSSLSKIDGKYYCKSCSKNPTGKLIYYCNTCHNYSAYAVMKGNGWIELVLYLFYFVPGIIYSLWRRSNKPNICAICNAEGLILDGNANDYKEEEKHGRDEVDCPFCAEKILAKANVCKFCGREVRIK